MLAFQFLSDHTNARAARLPIPAFHRNASDTLASILDVRLQALVREGEGQEVCASAEQPAEQALLLAVLLVLVLVSSLRDACHISSSDTCAWRRGELRRLHLRLARQR